MLFIFIVAVIISLLVSRKHEADLDQAVIEDSPTKAISAGTKAIVWTVITLFFAVFMMMLLGTAVGLPK